MNLFLIPRNNKWYLIILWWELARIPYNIIMVFAGLGSFYIAYATIPLLYIVIGLLFNCVFTLGWVIELSSQRNLNTFNSRKKFRVYFFFGYLILSILLTFSLSLFMIM
jgi:hypothetical protein